MTQVTRVHSLAIQSVFLSPFLFLDEHLVFSHIFLSYFFSYQWRCDVQRTKNLCRRVEISVVNTCYEYPSWYLSWISVVNTSLSFLSWISVMNASLSFPSWMSVVNTRFPIRKKNSGRVKVGLREMKMTERKRSEEEVEVRRLYERSSSSLLVRKLLNVAPIIKLDILNYQRNKTSLQESSILLLSASIYPTLGQRWAPRTRNNMWIISHSSAQLEVVFSKSWANTN